MRLTPVDKLPEQEESETTKLLREFSNSGYKYMKITWSDYTEGRKEKVRVQLAIKARDIDGNLKFPTVVMKSINGEDYLIKLTHDEATAQGRLPVV